MRPVLALALTPALGGCILGDVEMTRFSTCTEYSAYMKRAELVGAFESSGLGFDLSEVLVSDLGADDGSGGTDAPAIGATSFTDTNLQDAGVDEADLVKTDGAIAVAVSGGDVVISGVWPVTEAAVLASVAVAGDAVGVYLYDATAVVISEIGHGVAPDVQSGEDPWDGEAGWRDADAVGVTVIDVSDPANPAVVRETVTTGTLRETRRIDDTLYVVTSEDVGDDSPADGDLGDFAIANGVKWLSLRFDNRITDDGWTAVSEPACDCDDVWAPGGGTETLLTSVIALDLADPTSEFAGAAVVGPAHVVMASPSALYLANAVEAVAAFGSELDGHATSPVDTEIHKFDLTGAAPAYVASTRVGGLIHDRFSLSEQDGVLRVATMELDTSTSGVTTLETDGDGFVELDHLGGLAPGEDLTTARFIGDRGFLVTYVERKDPLFVLDLSDPTAIAVGGELEISGWSDYLHPMATPGKLFAVGTDFEWDGTARISASIFDVSDPDRPRLADRVLLDASDTEASFDHHAFTYDPESGYVTIPLGLDSGDTVLQVLHATDGDVVAIGRVTQAASVGTAPIRRGIHLEDMALAFSEDGLTAAPLDAPMVTMAQVAY